MKNYVYQRNMNASIAWACFLYVSNVILVWSNFTNVWP